MKTEKTAHRMRIAAPNARRRRNGPLGHAIRLAVLRRRGPIVTRAA